MKYYIKQFLKTYNAKFLIWACIVLGTLLFFHEFWKLSAKEHSAPTRQEIKLSKTLDYQEYQGVRLTKNDLKDMLKTQFDTYGISDQLKVAEAIISCESGWNIYADNGISFGILQFTKPTWKDFGSGDIMNPYWQIKTFASMWSRGLKNRWDCFRLGYYKKYL